jgi:hypothetical protein
MEPLSTGMHFLGRPRQGRPRAPSDLRRRGVDRRADGTWRRATCGTSTRTDDDDGPPVAPAFP